jgi:hypothetical protein
LFSNSIFSVRSESVFTCCLSAMASERRRIHPWLNAFGCGSAAPGSLWLFQPPCLGRKVDNIAAPCERRYRPGKLKT